MVQDQVKLSPSSLAVYNDCPRCFWLQMKEKKRRPSGGFPSLPAGMDNVIKKYYDKYKGSLPPELKNGVEGVLMEDRELLNKWRNWQSGLKYEDKKRNAILFGALDDCLQVGKKYAPLDYKTRGYPPKSRGELYYQHQLDAYSLLLFKNKYPITDFAYLVYYFPKSVEENGVVNFYVEGHKVMVKTDRALKMFEDAVDFLRGEEPSVHTYKESCAFCSWAEGSPAGMQEFD